MLHHVRGAFDASGLATGQPARRPDGSPYTRPRSSLRRRSAVTGPTHGLVEIGQQRSAPSWQRQRTIPTCIVTSVPGTTRFRGGDAMDRSAARSTTTALWKLSMAMQRCGRHDDVA